MRRTPPALVAFLYLVISTSLVNWLAPVPRGLDPYLFGTILSALVYSWKTALPFFLTTVPIQLWLYSGHYTSHIETARNLLYCATSLAIIVGVHVLRKTQLRLQSEINRLTGLLPICAGCKKIRNQDGEWEQMEVYIRRHSGADFSHGLCGGCIPIYWPDADPLAPSDMRDASSRRQ
ncbi:MAG TPA: hypothetical protein VFL57_07245 [Bryobacteraceae bacterium]|nr:hypothetical protein [Bryobacteraceae bacterium]